jgi:beta-hydroxylase
LETGEAKKTVMNNLTEKNPSYFYEIKVFPELKPLVNHWKIIQDELYHLLKTSTDNNWLNTFPEYVENKENRSWKVFSFLFFQMKSKKHAALCPKTAELVYSIPSILSCDFSLLPRNTKIKPHEGYTRMVLRCHLPLIVPEGNKCGLRVGDKIHLWREGELVIFDDSFEHEAWNDSNDDRVVLMFDIPNPRWGYNAEEISRYKIENLADPFLLSFASKDEWLRAFKARELPLEEF